MKYEIHISDVRSFKQCRRKWDFSSPLRQNMERKIAYAPFFTGRAIHYAIQRWYEEHEKPEDSLPRFYKSEIGRMEVLGPLWDAERNIIEEQVDLIDGLMEHYIQWATTEPDSVWSDSNLQFLALETTFSVPFYAPSGRKSSRVFLAGRLDGVVQRKDDGSIWIWENKTTRSIKELQDSLINDEQCGAYLIAMEEILKKPVSGVLYNMLRKKIPTSPRLLQSGYLSQATDMDTTAEWYLKVAKETHPDASVEELYQTYAKMFDYLIEKGNTFFARIPIRRTDAEKRSLRQDLHIVALEMVRPTTPIYSAPSWINCQFCSFKSPCLAMNAGRLDSFEFQMEQEYQKRQNWDTMEGEVGPNEARA